MQAYVWQEKYFCKCLDLNPSIGVADFFINFFCFFIYLTRKCLVEIKNLLYKRVLAKTAAVAHDTKFHTIQHKTVTDNIFKKDYFF